MPRIVIVGGGIAGVSTAWFLARRGETDVVLLERERGLGWHSTGLNAAILRTATTDLVTEGFTREGAEFLLNPPPGFASVPLVDPCGIVLATGLAGSARSEWELRLASRGDVEELSPARLAELAPHFRTLAERAWFVRSEGRIDIAALLQGFENGARRAGVSFRTGARVRALARHRGSVRGVELDDGSALDAELVVVAAGGWAEELGREAGSRVELRPTRRHLCVTEADARVDPRWPVVWTDADPFYARPESGGRLLCSCDEDDVDPDALDTMASVREEIAIKNARHLPEFRDARIAEFWAGIRTLTHDDRFVIGPDRDVDGLFWVAGLGGHGMSAAAAIGALAADWIVDGESRHPARAHVDPRRFALRARPDAERAGR